MHDGCTPENVYQSGNFLPYAYFEVSVSQFASCAQ